MEERASDLDVYAEKLRKHEISGEDLAKMVDGGTLSKTERRIITKKAKKPELTPRQKLRQEIKAKKALPRAKLSKDARRDRFSTVDEVEERRLKDKANFMICLGCRKRGHLLKDCPKAAQVADDVKASVDGMCFNCGGTDHTLKDCRAPRDKSGKLPYAACFICKQKGHIARDCNNNANGLYPQGGCCHICLQKTHLAKDCPERTEEMKAQWAKQRELQRQREEDKELGPRLKGISQDEPAGGDDLGGDFYDNNNDNDNDEEDGEQTKDRKDKKKKKKRDREDDEGGAGEKKKSERKRGEKKTKRL